MHNVKCKNTKQMIISNTDIHATKVILSLSEVILSTACQIQSQSVLFLKGQECKKGIAEPMTRMFFFVVVVVFYRGFLSRPFTIHRTAGEGGGHFFNSSLPLPPASQTLRH